MRIDHDRDWIIGCIKHDGFIKTDRFDKANQIILEALEPKDGDLISRTDAIEAVMKYAKENKANADNLSRKQHSDVFAKEITEYRSRAFGYANSADIINALPSADAVSREEYHKLLRDKISFANATVPSAEAVQGWIPCSESLPTQTGEYLATVDHNGYIFTDKFGYEPVINGGWYDVEAPNQKFVDWNDSIVAWMPLPKPYKGGDSE